MDMQKPKIYCIITVITLVALAALIYSSSCKEIIVGISASLVAAYIFMSFLEIIPYYRDAYKRRIEAAILYRDLQLFLTRIDDYFLVPYWVKNIKDNEPNKEYDSWVKNTGLRLEEVFSLQFYNDYVRNFDWNETYPHTGMNCRKYFEIEWGDIKEFTERILNRFPLLQEFDIELAYLLQHIGHDSLFNFLFKFSERESNLQHGFKLLAWNGENQMEKDIFSPLKRIHSFVWNIYETIQKDSSLPGEIYTPRFYEKNRGSVL